MSDKILHIPEGVRDIFGEEYVIKADAEHAVKECMQKYGFLQIKTPTFEYFDIFNSERGTVSSKDMFKFIDRDGETLVLRPDMTPQIARCVARYYKNETLPVRLFYHGNTFINNSGFQGKLKEITQIGAELVNDGSIRADAEMICLMIDSLLAIGLSDFQIEIGTADFFRALSEEADFSEEEKDELRGLIEAKNVFGVEELLKDKDIDPSLKELFIKMPLQFGSVELLKNISGSFSNERANSSISRLLAIYDLLCAYGREKYVSFDLGMLSLYNYYTGVVFKAYTHKTGEPVAAGGRYDRLLSQFGKNAPAIGIAIYTDYALTALQRQGKKPAVLHDRILVVYEESCFNRACAFSDGLRKEGKKVALVMKDEKTNDGEYATYARQILAGEIMFFDGSDECSVLTVGTGVIRKRKLQVI